MTTITLASTAPVHRLEELVDRLLATLFPAHTGPTAPAPVGAIHEARRLRQAGDLDGALTALANVDTRQADVAELRWLYAEWLDVARRRFADASAMLYSPATGKAAVLVPAVGDGNPLEVAAVLGMRWPVGKTVSRRSLRGLKPLHKRGGASWS